MSQLVKQARINQALKSSIILVPALNEEENLAYLLPRITKLTRVIVIDNNSSDRSAQVAIEQGAQVVHCPTKGYGATMLAALDYISSHFDERGIYSIIVFDGDNSSPHQFIEELVAKLYLDDCDLVLAQRDLRQKGSLSWHVRAGNVLIVALIAFLTRRRFVDMGPLRVIRYQSLLALKMKDKNWGWNVEMQIKAHFKGFKVSEIMIPYNKRLYGRSKISGNLRSTLIVGSKIIYSIFYYWLNAVAVERLAAWKVWRFGKRV